MPLNLNKQKKLKHLIDDNKAFEGRYYLLYLYDTLIKSKKTSATIDDIADKLIVLIEKINYLKNAGISNDNKIPVMQEITEHYNALAKEVGVGGVFYNCKQALLMLCGLILSVFSGVFGAAIGSIALGLNDIIKFRAPTGVLVGACTGLLVGCMIGYRAPNTLFNESEKNTIQHSVKSIATTFESLFAHLEKDYLKSIKEEVLTNYFNGNQEQFNLFLKEKQKYQILGTSAEFLSKKLKGFLGHHSFIKFTINNTGSPKLIEMGASSDKEIEFSQETNREASGEQLMYMLVMHKLLQQQYVFSLSNLPTLASRYKPGIMDCHTYINKVLVSAGEPVSTVRRFTENDTYLGRFLGSTLQFFSPLPDKPKLSEPFGSQLAAILSKP